MMSISENKPHMLSDGELSAVTGGDWEALSYKTVDEIDIPPDKTQGVMTITVDGVTYENTAFFTDHYYVFKNKETGACLLVPFSR